MIKRYSIVFFYAKQNVFSEPSNGPLKFFWEGASIGSLKIFWGGGRPVHSEIFDDTGEIDFKW